MYEHITQSALSELLKLQGHTFLSLYMPMERTFPGREQNPIRYRNLLRQLREHLDLSTGAAGQHSLLEPFEALLSDDRLWNSPRSGLAVIGGDNLFRVFSLHQSVPEQVRVDRQPYLKPLLRLSQAAGTFQVLCVTRDAVRLFEGDHDVLHEVELHPAVPRNLEQALGSELTEKNQSGHPDGFSRAAEKAGGMTMHESGGGGKQDEIDIDRERYFRAIDKAIGEHHSRRSGLPLILAALPRNQAAFRAVSHNPQLLDEGVTLDPALLDGDALRQPCGEIMSKRYSAWLDTMLERYGAAQGKQLACENVPEIGEAVFAGRVAVLLVESGRNLPGVVNQQSGAVDLYEVDGDGKAAEAGADVLDQLIPRAVQTGAEVVVVPPGLLPDGAGAAAVFRF